MKNAYSSLFMGNGKAMLLLISTLEVTEINRGTNLIKLGRFVERVKCW